MLLKLRFLIFAVTVVADIIFGDIHRHLQRVLLLLHDRTQFVCTAATQLMRLIAVGINRCSGITQRTYQVDVVIYIPAQRVVVVIDENRIRPALIGHLEGLDEPIVASLTSATECLFNHFVAILMVAYSLVHHVNHGQGSKLCLGMIEPGGHGAKTLTGRQVV